MLKAKGNFIIICRRSYPERVCQDGIILTALNNEDFFEGVVHSVGSYCEDLALQQGDWVLVKNHNFKLEIGNCKAGKIYAVESDDIICVIDDDE
jgi:co-chaperonin GroES (HSP10)